MPGFESDCDRARDKYGNLETSQANKVYPEETGESSSAADPEHCGKWKSKAYKSRQQEKEEDRCRDEEHIVEAGRRRIDYQESLRRETRRETLEAIVGQRWERRERPGVTVAELGAVSIAASLDSAEHCEEQQPRNDSHHGSEAGDV